MIIKHKRIWLEDNGFQYQIRNMLYVNKESKKIITLQFIESDRFPNEVDNAQHTDGWAISSLRLSEHVKKEIIEELEGK